METKRRVDACDKGETLLGPNQLTKRLGAKMKDEEHGHMPLLMWGPDMDKI